MFGLGPWELAIIGTLAVLLFGSRLPEVARSLGGSYQQFRKGLRDIQTDLDVNQYLHDDTTSYTSTNTSFKDEDYDTPTAPKFEPPPAEKSAVEKNAEEKSQGSES